MQHLCFQTICLQNLLLECTTSCSHVQAILAEHLTRLNRDIDSDKAQKEIEDASLRGYSNAGTAQYSTGG